MNENASELPGVVPRDEHRQQVERETSFREREGPSLGTLLMSRIEGFAAEAQRLWDDGKREEAFARHCQSQGVLVALNDLAAWRLLTPGTVTLDDFMLPHDESFRAGWEAAMNQQNPPMKGGDQ